MKRKNTDKAFDAYKMVAEMNPETSGQFNEYGAAACKDLDSRHPEILREWKLWKIEKLNQAMSEVLATE